MANGGNGHFFPGSNTADGFVGYFEHLRRRAQRAVILKGGPGVGKSTLMAAVGARFEGRGEPVAYFHCSGDPDSLDAVFAPEAGYLVLDGTAPHVIDPRLPGARDGILNLGVCLNEKQLEKEADAIEALTGEIAACYAQAYRYLAAAGRTRRRCMPRRFRTRTGGGWCGSCFPCCRRRQREGKPICLPRPSPGRAFCRKLIPS